MHGLICDGSGSSPELSTCKRWLTIALIIFKYRFTGEKALQNVARIQFIGARQRPEKTLGLGKLGGRTVIALIAPKEDKTLDSPATPEQLAEFLGSLALITPRGEAVGGLHQPVDQQPGFRIFQTPRDSLVTQNDIDGWTPCVHDL